MSARNRGGDHSRKGRLGSNDRLDHDRQHSRRTHVRWPHERFFFTSGDGDITVFIPANMGLSVRTRNDSGSSARVVSDFPELQLKTVGFARRKARARSTAADRYWT